MDSGDVNSTVLLVAGVLALGLVLAVTGTLLLGNARALARHSGPDVRTRADLGQYLAGFVALLGFVAVGAGAALAATVLLPLTGMWRGTVAAVIGGVMFVGSGAVSARMATRVEERRAAAMRPIRAVAGPSWADRPVRSGTGTLIGSVGGPPADTALAPPAGGPAVDRDVRPGWVYQDQAGAWYMGVTTHSGDPQLLELPAFSLVGARQPVYPLHPAGAGEVAVVPMPGMDGGDPNSW